MMKLTRLTETSLYYKIKELLSIKRTNELAKKSVDFKSCSLKYNNIATAFDVVVYIDGALATSGYVVDYINGVINFNPALTSANEVRVDYYYCPFNIYDEGSNELTNNFKYPAIAIFSEETDTRPFELGSSQTEKIKTIVIQVWTERSGERSDVADSILEMLEGSIPIIDYNEGFPVNSDGTINASFNPSNILTVATAESINCVYGGSLEEGKKPKYLSEIYVDFNIYI